VFTDDWKSALQEWMQANGRGLPVYRLAAAEGPITASVSIRGAGRRRTRWPRSRTFQKEAEQHAARQALTKLKGVP
jgi:dsRNA-specific ribonuclease